MTTTKNNEHKKLNFSNEQEQSQACLNSAEHEKNQGRKVLNVPNLRFQEFEGEWRRSKFKKVITLQRGSSPRPIIKYITTSTDGVNWIKIGDMPHFGRIVTSTEEKITREGAKKSRLVKKGDLILSNSMSYGLPYIMGVDGYIHDGWFVLKDFEDTFDKDYLCNLLISSAIQNQYKRLAAGGVVQNISSDLVNSVSVSIPLMEEQKKISSLLNLIDDRITTQNKIIDKLQSLIKGIVDCTILRKEKNAIVGDVCSISEQIRAEANIDDIITVRLHGNGVCKSSAEYLQLGATQYYRRRAGQLIYGKQNFHNGAIGIVPISLDKGITSKDIPSFDIDEMKCNSVYLLAQLQSPQYYKPAEALTTGTGSKRLKEETFLKMPIVLPNKREQDNIAVLIHRASMNLDHAKRLLELLSIQKQFLLRQMFI